MKENNEELEKEVGCGSSCSACSMCDNTEEEYEPTITLVDEEGKEVQFEILDVIILEDEKQYLVVTEAGKDENAEVEVVILEIKEENGEEVYDTVTDEAIAEEVFNTYTAQFEEEEENEE